MAFLGNYSKSAPAQQSKKQKTLCPHCHKDINELPSETPTANSPEFVKHMIQAIQMEALEKLTKWELEFIESVASKEKLSPKQIAIVERIYGDKV